MSYGCGEKLRNIMEYLLLWTMDSHSIHPIASRGWNTERIRESCRSLPPMGEDTHVNSVAVKKKNNLQKQQRKLRGKEECRLISYWIAIPLGCAMLLTCRFYCSVKNIELNSPP